MKYFFTYPCFCEEDRIEMFINSPSNITMQIRVSTFCRTCEEACTRFNKDVSLIEAGSFLEKLSYEVRSYFLLHHQEHWMNLFKSPLSPSQINDVFQSFDSTTARLMISKQLNGLELFSWLQNYPSLSSMNNVFSILNKEDTYLQLRIDTVETYFRLKREPLPLYL